MSGNTPDPLPAPGELRLPPDVARRRVRRVRPGRAAVKNQLVCGLAIAATLGLVACSDDDNSSDSNSAGPANAALDQGDQRGQALDNLATGEFQSAPDEVAIAKSADIVATINAGEIAEANFVLSKSTNNDVRVLATEIAADHQDNAAMLQALMTRLASHRPATRCRARSRPTPTPGSHS